MPRSGLIEHWLGLFSPLQSLERPHLDAMRAAVAFKRLDEGTLAYTQGAPCLNYVMCMEGRTRTFKRSAEGRELLLYRVSPGGTCVLTTSCLLARRGFPAESVAEAPVLLAAIPASLFYELMSTAPPFRNFVLDQYGELMANLIALVDDVAFASLNVRLARLLLGRMDPSGGISATHQQLAQDVGSVREVVSRTLRDWERAGWINSSRGTIGVVDSDALRHLCAVSQ